MSVAEQLAERVGTAPACQGLGLCRASLYRRRRRAANPSTTPRAPRPSPRRALSEAERQQVLEVLHSQRFVDASPGQVYATLLDEGQFLCSERTMYRLLARHGESRERRNQLRHPAYAKPELLATAPNQVWSWDITKLKGPAKWVHYYLYVILDIFSRYVVGWMLAERESALLAQQLIQETLEKFTISRHQLTLHADRGPSMKAKSLALLLADLGVTKTHNRPYTSNDNPYSEAQFKTLKYHPDFPHRFGAIQDGRSFCRRFFLWYNEEHRHTSLALLTPATVHFGLTDQTLEQRCHVLQCAYQAHPERFNQPPRPKQPPAEAWINPPRRDNDTNDLSK
jgi:putative transposase